MTGWGVEVFSFYNQWWIVPILATHLGAILGAWIYYIAVGGIWSVDSMLALVSVLTIITTPSSRDQLAARGG